MTVYVVPCGLSIFDALTAMTGPTGTTASDLADRASGLGTGVLGRADADVPGWWAGEMADDAEYHELVRWDPRVLSAETNTVTAAGCGPLGELSQHGHTVVLAASDVGRGVAAALCVAQHITGPALTGVTYTSTPADLKNATADPRYVRGPVSIVRLRGLDPGHPGDGFVQGIAGIGHVLRAALDTGHDVQVHLTGGFKATLLHTLAMTEILSSLAPGRVSARYVYEDAARTTVQDSTAHTIGLRRSSPETLEAMRKELVRARDGHHPTLHALRGVAWDIADGKLRLNAFGYGYLAILGEPLSAVAPPSDTG